MVVKSRDQLLLTPRLTPLTRCTVVDLCLHLWPYLMAWDRYLVSIANWATERSKGLYSATPLD